MTCIATSCHAFTRPASSALPTRPVDRTWPRRLSGRAPLVGAHGGSSSRTVSCQDPVRAPLRAACKPKSRRHRRRRPCMTGRSVVLSLISAWLLDGNTPPVTVGVSENARCHSGGDAGDGASASNSDCHSLNPRNETLVAEWSAPKAMDQLSVRGNRLVKRIPLLGRADDVDGAKGLVRCRGRVARTVVLSGVRGGAERRVRWPRPLRSRLRIAA